MEDSDDTSPGLDVHEGASSVRFGLVKSGCTINPPSQKLGASGSLTLAVWIKTSSPGDM